MRVRVHVRVRACVRAYMSERCMSVRAVCVWCEMYDVCCVLWVCVSVSVGVWVCCVLARLNLTC